MSLTPQSSTTDIVAGFATLQTRRDVANLLGIPLKQLTYHVFVKKKDAYVTFKVPKASGGERVISSPITPLKIIQRNLADILNVVYRPKSSVHGFVQERNIVSNAQTHLGARFVLNVDLKDFFPSINFGRVRGLFMGKPYALPDAVATILAQICCHDNYLPQGAPTSPIVSNMICGKLDSDLQKLANRYNCLYSRYADDLTFSTRVVRFPKSLARQESLETGISVTLGGELEGAIEANGFRVNPVKTRLHSRNRRQEVTGLTINKFPNTQRRFNNRIRAMLHAWETYGFENAQNQFLAVHYRKYRNPKLPDPSFARVLKGRIDFLGMVRGKDDSLYIRYLRWYGRLNPDYKVNVVAGKHTSFDMISDALWVLETAYDDPKNGLVVKQGTAFALAGIGLVTCAHVVHDSETEAFQVTNLNARFKVTVLAKNDDLDLAVLEIDHNSPIELAAANPGEVKPLDAVTVLGFPNYNVGDGVLIHRGHVTGFRPRHGIRRVLVNASIVQGNSGGPVLDQYNRVIGVAVTGASDEANAHLTENHGVIPVDAFSHLKASAAAP